MFIIRLAAEALSIADSQPMAMNIKKSPSTKSSNFLYSILSGQEDTAVVQKRSELCYSNSSSVSDYMDRLLCDNSSYSQKQRSNSVVVHRSKVKSVSNFGRRPSSVPEPNRFTPYPLHKRLHQEAASNSRNNDGYSMGSPARSVSTDSGLDEPLDLTKQMLGHGSPEHSDQDSLTNSPISCGGLTLSIPHFKSSESYSSTKCVQLSKKMARPVQCRINEWFRQMVNLVIPNSSPCSSSIGQLSAERRLSLLQASWHRVLVLYMAENTLRFVTSPLQMTEESDHSSSLPANRAVRPTQNFVDQLTALIDACSNLPFDQATYDLIRIAVILIGNQRSLDVNSLKLLEQHLAPTVNINQFRSIMSQITTLDKAQLEALFCSHFDVPVEEKLKTYFEQLSISV